MTLPFLFSHSTPSAPSSHQYAPPVLQSAGKFNDPQPHSYSAILMHHSPTCSSLTPVATPPVQSSPVILSPWITALLQRVWTLRAYLDLCLSVRSSEGICYICIILQLLSLSLSLCLSRSVPRGSS